MNHPKYILCVDDDEDDRILLSEALTEYQSSVNLEFAHSGSNAVDFIKNAIDRKDLPQLITLDINMPEINGWDTLRFLQAVLANNYVPILILTTAPQNADIWIAEIKGVTIYQKPQNMIGYSDLAKKIFTSILE